MATQSLCLVSSKRNTKTQRLFGEDSCCEDVQSTWTLLFLRRSKGEFLVENHKSSAHGRLHKNTTMGCGGASANSSMWIPTQCHFQWLQQLPFHCRWGTWSEEPEPFRENAELGLPRKGWQKLATEPLRERETREEREERERHTRER